MKVVNHRLESESVVHLQTPNCDQRPDGEDISLLVIHNITLPPGEFGGTFVQDFFMNQLDYEAHPFFKEIQSLKVSSHLFIRREGELIQFSGFDQRAWHAGLSSFGHRTNCNDFSIGIELEGTDDHPYTDQQYEVLKQVTLCLQKAYPRITKDRIVGHQDIAPGRKTDPGPSFDWDRYLNGINA
ncbi:MAG: 1,6-anhydro-N-acetylmuramyl-L-alanine amidase AmpD [Bdellovibrionales bacterium]|nr:1,6-anhydro-N-acetylmuramyl-L-alanine amidase AmpD [Bdellovibrionales bacterium]